MIHAPYTFSLPKITFGLCAALLLAACAGASNPDGTSPTLSPGSPQEATAAPASSTTDELPSNRQEGTLEAEFQPIYPAAPATVRPPEVVQADIREERHLLLGHLGGVIGPVWSPSGEALASGDGEGFIRIWDPVSGEQIQVLGGWELSPISALAWSPDGERLATGHEDGQLNLWALEGGSMTNSIQEHQVRINSLAWSPDGRWLASADDEGTFLLWEGQSALPIDRYEDALRIQSIPDFEWFPGSTAAAWAGPRGRAWFWNLEGDLVSLLPEELEQGEAFTSVAISPDATTLALGSSAGLIRLWDLDSGDEFDPLDRHTGPVLDLDFSPDGSKLVSAGSDGKLILWDIEDQVGLRTLRDRVNVVLGTAWSPNGRWIAAALDDGTVRVYSE
jgi:WD40 repeat protein